MQIGISKTLIIVLLLLFSACSNKKILDRAIESEDSDSIALSNKIHNYIIGDSTITLYLHNNSFSLIYYGDDYNIEEFDSISSSWNNIKFNANIVFPLNETQLSHGGIDTLTIYLYPNFYSYKPGEYRISKDIIIDGYKHISYFYFTLKRK